MQAEELLRKGAPKGGAAWGLALLLFTSKATTAPMYTALANQFQGKIAFGEVKPPSPPASPEQLSGMSGRRHHLPLQIPWDTNVSHQLDSWFFVPLTFRVPMLSIIQCDQRILRCTVHCDPDTGTPGSARQAAAAQKLLPNSILLLAAVRLRAINVS